MLFELEPGILKPARALPQQGGLDRDKAVAKPLSLGRLWLLLSEKQIPKLLKTLKMDQN